MKFPGFLSLNKLFMLILVCLSANTACATPLYQEKFPQAPAKVVLPDPLEAAASAELPMVHNNNYDMIMPDFYDHNPASSMQYQNFQAFYDPEMVDNNEYNMDETQFVHTNPVRAPQPLTHEERRIRQKLEEVDEKHERKQLLKLKKGSTRPRYNAPQWDQFDYDSYSVDPDKKHKKSYNYY